LSLRAQASRKHLYDNRQLSPSATLMIYSSDLRIAPDSGSGTTINVETGLGLETTNLQPRVAGRFRLGKRNEIELGFQWATRSSEKTLMDTLVVGDTTFAAGLRVAIRMTTSQPFLAYRFAFMARERTQLGLGVGIGAILMHEDIDALTGTTAGGQDTTITQFSHEKTVPWPTFSVGLFGRFRVGNHWYVDADARGVYLKIQDISASIFEGGGAVKYFFSDTFGAELGYDIGAYSVALGRNDRIDFSGKLKYLVQGVRVGVIFAL
jgi:hypothetical protein